MRFAILVVVLALMVVPAVAQNYLGPIPGVYKTQLGQMSEGVFSESWVDAPHQEGMIHNTIHAWDNMQGAQWHVYCPSISHVSLLVDTRDGNGNGFVQYSTDYAGGTLWLSQAGPWAPVQPVPLPPIDFTATIASFNVVSTHIYYQGQQISVDSDIRFMGYFNPPVEPGNCFEYVLSNGAILGYTPMPFPAGYPPFLDYYNCPTGTTSWGAWGIAEDITLTIYGHCTIATEESSWGKIKALYSE
jgi:hypothetical protein